MLEPTIPTNVTVSKSKKWRAFFGLLGFVITTGFLGSAALLLNSAIVYSLHRGISPLVPSFFDVTQFWQFVIFVGPILLLALEWMAWDALTTRFRKKP